MKYLFICLLFHSFASAQIDRIEPPFWWQGMKNKKLNEKRPSSFLLDISWGDFLIYTSIAIFFGYLGKRYKK